MNKLYVRMTCTKRYVLIAEGPFEILSRMAARLNDGSDWYITGP